MKALLCLQQTSNFIANPSSHKPKLPTLQPKRTWPLHAKAKGFSGTSSSSSSKESIVPKRNSQKNDENGNKDDDDDEIPQVVLNRMMVRILVYVGVPLATGVVILQGFSVVKEENLVDVPNWLPFLTTFITFGASALGIALGTLSASWDPERKGSLLGFEEAQKNWVELWKEDDDSNR